MLIDVFEATWKEGQPARVLSKIKPPATGGGHCPGIFTELEILDGDPSGYYLVRTNNQTPLDDEAEMGRQRLSPARLSSAGAAPATGAQPFSRRMLLLASGPAEKVFRLHWETSHRQGRSVDSQPHGDAPPDGTRAIDFLAVDLRAFPTGLRV